MSRRGSTGSAGGEGPPGDDVGPLVSGRGAYVRAGPRADQPPDANPHARGLFPPGPRLPGSSAAGASYGSERDGDHVGNRLLMLRPDLSAAVPVWPAQKAILAGVLAALGLLLALAPDHAAAVLSLSASLVFLSVVVLRLLAVRHALALPSSVTPARARARRNERLPAAPRPTFSAGPTTAAAGLHGASPPEQLPTYAVLVALYDEAAVIPGLVQALAALDYPATRLAIRLVVEERDRATQAAIGRTSLPPHIEMLVVPDGKPRTKPRALNYALSRTPGEYVVVYDAEDVPERDQLRRALAAFAAAPPATGCMQARLNVMNHDESWVSRQFSIEYTALFDCMLPTLERHAMPIPLGGTSNHFRRVALEAALAWDPCNVTEDADLGIRLSRFGIGVGVFASTTWEEAPPTFRVWLGQRTRWLKGWMLTYLVHMRAPRRLAGELGGWGFAGLQLYMVSAIVSPLVHPWFLAMLVYDVASGRVLAGTEGALEASAWWLAVTTLCASYVSTMLLGAIAVVRRGRLRLLAQLAWLPVYWLAISLAAYRAMHELLVAPHHWQKTPHRARARNRAA